MPVPAGGGTRICAEPTGPPGSGCAGEAGGREMVHQPADASRIVDALFQERLLVSRSAFWPTAKAAATS